MEIYARMPQRAFATVTADLQGFYFDLFKSAHDPFQTLNILSYLQPPHDMIKSCMAHHERGAMDG
jgi:hypothetical protein